MGRGLGCRSTVHCLWRWVSVAFDCIHCLFLMYVGMWGSSNSLILLCSCTTYVHNILVVVILFALSGHCHMCSHCTSYIVYYGTSSTWSAKFDSMVISTYQWFSMVHTGWWPSVCQSRNSVSMWHGVCGSKEPGLHALLGALGKQAPQWRRQERVLPTVWQVCQSLYIPHPGGCDGWTTRGEAENHHPCHQPQHGKILSSEVKYVLLVLRMYSSLSLSTVFVFSKGTSIVLRLNLTCMVKKCCTQAEAYAHTIYEFMYECKLQLIYGICFCLCLCLSAAFVHSTW